MKTKLLFTLFLFAAFLTVPAFAQEKTSAPKNQCNTYGEADFFGEPISFKVVDTDIRDVLLNFTRQFGCNFVFDEAIGKAPMTVNVSDVPWNLVLYSILESQDLAIEVKDTVLRVAEIKKLKEEGKGRFLNDPWEKIESLYTEFIKLKNLPTCPDDPECKKTTIKKLERLKEIITRHLTRRGSVEMDERSKTLIITDVRRNREALKKLLVLFYTEGFYKEKEEDK